MELLHLALAEGRVVTTNPKTRRPCHKNFSGTNNQPHPNLNRKKIKGHSVYGITVSSVYWFLQNIISFFSNSLFMRFPFTVQQHSFLSFQRRNPLVSRLWTRFCHSDCKMCGPRNDTELPGTSSESLELFFVSKTKNYKQLFSSNTNHSQTAKNA